MIHSVTVHQNNLVLPNGQVYQSGNVALLSDRYFSKISPLLFTNDNIS